MPIAAVGPKKPTFYNICVQTGVIALPLLHPDVPTTPHFPGMDLNFISCLFN